ncbi:DUF1990 domain-containing protein [soil metagenome]
MPAKLPLWERPVTYASVGATQSADLLTKSPSGYRPFRQRMRIGHGDARWDYAWTEVMSWGIQRTSGFRVDVADVPAAVSDQTYVPVAFDEAGAPVADTVLGDEVVFGPDGAPFIVPGDSVVLEIPFGPFQVTAPARVVYVVNEVNRRGFAYGTLPGHPESGEESFIVEQTEDGSVWLEISAFSRPANVLWWLVYPVLRFTQAYYTRRYFESLSGTLSPTTGA